MKKECMDDGGGGKMSLAFFWYLLHRQTADAAAYPLLKLLLGQIRGRGKENYLSGISVWGVGWKDIDLVFFTSRFYGGMQGFGTKKCIYLNAYPEVT